MLNQKAGAKNSPEESLGNIFGETFQQISKQSAQPEIEVRFYPFVGLNHTIRIRKQRVYVRISDLLQDAPAAVYRALAQILVRKLFRRRPKVEYEIVYRDYINQSHILRASELAKQSRGRKQLNGAVGRKYDLEQIFSHLNHTYFQDTLPQPILSWSTRHTRRILGHHDAIHDAIVISRSLDKESVPAYVVEYVMYHEMLHVKHKSHVSNGRRIFHSAAFRAEEKQFAHYQAAIHWLAHSSKQVR